MPGPAYVAFWLDRFESATACWSNQEVGAYIRLLMHQAQEGSIPDDVGRLARIAREDQAAFAGFWKAVLRAKFDPSEDDPGQLVNQRMAHERAVAMRKADVARENGTKGGRPKKPTGLPTGPPGRLPGSKATQTQTQNQTHRKHSAAETPPGPAAAAEVSLVGGQREIRTLALDLFWGLLKPAGLGQNVVEEAVRLLEGPRWLGGHHPQDVREVLEHKSLEASEKDNPGGWLLSVVRGGLEPDDEDDDFVPHTPHPQADRDWRAEQERQERELAKLRAREAR